jgi:serralysin
VTTTSPSSSDSGLSAEAFVPGTDLVRQSNGISGGVWVSAAALTTTDFRSLPLHELGHAIFGFNDVTTNAGLNGAVLPKELNDQLHTVMSYSAIPGTVTGADYTPTAGGFSTLPSTPMVLDMLAAQYVYGPNASFHAGNDTYRFLPGQTYFETIWDAGGENTFDLSQATKGAFLDLRPGQYSDVGSSVSVYLAGGQQTLTKTVGVAYGVTIQNAVGGAGADTILGNDADNGLTGGAGNDTMDGGAGTDVARYSGASTSYSWSRNPDGSWTVSDTRPGGPDGVDMLRKIETLQFSERAVAIGTAANILVRDAFANVLRLNAPGGDALALRTSLESSLEAGQLTGAEVVAQTVAKAAATTSVATLAYEFFTGEIPSSAGMDYLVSPTGPNPNNLNSAYYQSFNLENRYINLAVNLGKAGEGAAQFASSYGSKTLLEATKTAYATIFGSTPTDAKAHALIDSRVEYFAAYGQDGAAGIGTKAAMVGWLMAEAVKADVGLYAKANDAFLIDLADGAAFAVDIVGVYGKPAFNYTGA